MRREQFTFYRSYYEALKNLPKRDQTAVLMAVIGYALDEDEPSLSGVPLSVFTLIRPTLDSGRNKAKNRMKKDETNQEQNKNKTKTKTEQTCKEGEKEREGESEKERQTDSSPPISPSERGRKKFVPPTVDEVRDYCQSRNNGIDPQSFVDHYAARGWRYNGNVPMKDWKAAVRTWEQKRKQSAASEPQKPKKREYREIRDENGEVIETIWLD